MRIALVGYGRMGRLIRQVATGNGHQIVAIVDPYSSDNEITSKILTKEAFVDAEVVVDFSAAEQAVEHILFYGKMALPAVMGTTGWYSRLPEVQEALKGMDCAIIWSGNFSLGVHLFFALARKAAALMNNFPQYDTLVHEMHHAGKADSPSGTAVMLGNILLEELEGKNQLETGRLDRKRADSEIHVSSTRGGSIPGTHTVMFDSPVDTIEITHRARNREGFAYGAVQAAVWVSSGRKGFFSLDDMLTDLIPR